jgi:predicted metal-binding transcription factor (methanogenesis marker protein 9)
MRRRPYPSTGLGEEGGYKNRRSVVYLCQPIVPCLIVTLLWVGVSETDSVVRWKKEKQTTTRTAPVPPP